MNNNIEEDIKNTKELIEEAKKSNMYNKYIRSVENILVDRGRLQIKANKYDSLVEKIKEKLNKRKAKYNEILSDYGNIDTDVVFNIPNANVRKCLDELSFEIVILQELLEAKEDKQ